MNYFNELKAIIFKGLPIVLSGIVLSLCAHGVSAQTVILTEDFGAGATNPGPPLPAGRTNLCYEDLTGSCNLSSNPAQYVDDGEYTIANDPESSFPGAFRSMSDNTGDANGRMMVINANFDPNVMYSQDLFVPLVGNNRSITISAYIANINTQGNLDYCATTPLGHIDPNVTLQVLNNIGVVIGSTDSGIIEFQPSNANVWQSIGTTIAITDGDTDFTVRIVNNADGGCGNDLALDDIVATLVQISAVDDAPTPINDASGGDSSVTVLEGDQLNGVAATLTTVTITAPIAGDYTDAVTGDPVTGLTLNPATGLVAVAPATPAGTYLVAYEICDQLNALNCAEAIMTVVVTAAPTSVTSPFNTGPGLSTSQCGVMPATSAWDGFGASWNNNPPEFFNNSRPEIFATLTEEVPVGITSGESNTFRDILRSSILDDFGYGRYLEYRFTTENFTDTHEIWGVGIAALGADPAYTNPSGQPFEEDSGAYRFAVAIDDEPGFASPEVLLTQGQVDGTDFPDADAVDIQIFDYNKFGFAHWDVDGTVVQLAPNTEYFVRVYIFNDTRSGNHFGQLFAPDEIVMIDDFTLKVASCSQLADLSLVKTAIDPTTSNPVTSAAAGDEIDFVISVTNAGPGNPTGVQVSELIPDGFAYVSDDAAANGDTYDAATGIWVLDQVLNGAIETLTIRATMQGSGNTTNMAEIIASSLPDPDSDVGVGSATDDLSDTNADDDEASVTVALDTGARLLVGRIFIDNGAGGGTAHDALINGSEVGSQAAVLSIFDGADALLAQPDIAADGSWSYELDASYAGPIKLQVQPLPGLIPISEATTGLPALVSADPHDGTYSFTPDASSNYTGLNFGIVRNATLTQDRDASVEGGQLVGLEHEYKSFSTGSVSFAYSNQTMSPANAFAATLFQDTDCDGDADTAINGPIAVAAGDRLCLISRVTANSGLGQGSNYSYDLSASTSLSDTTIVTTAQNTDRVVTGGGTGQLTLSKTVRNLTQNSAEGSSNGGAVGDTLEYRIYLKNPSGAYATDVTIYDQTPAYTVLANPITSPVAVGSDLTCTISLPTSNVAGYAGDLRWDCVGSFAPGDVGSVAFDVRISP